MSIKHMVEMIQKIKFFLFSIQEIGRYNDTLDFVVQATNYAIDKGAYAPETDTSGTMWRLRSPGHTQDRSACVRYNGVVDSCGLSSKLGNGYPSSNLDKILISNRCTLDKNKR